MGERALFSAGFFVMVVCTTVMFALFLIDPNPSVFAGGLFMGGIAAISWIRWREILLDARTIWPELGGDSITLRYDRKRVRNRGRACIVMSIAGAIMAIAGEDLPAMLFGWLFFALFGLSGLYWLLIVGVGPSVALHADALGLWFGNGRHPQFGWKDLKSVKIHHINRQKVLGFTTHADAAVWTDENATMPMMSKVYRFFGRSEFAIQQQIVGVPLEQVKQAVERLEERYA